LPRAGRRFAAAQQPFYSSAMAHALAEVAWEDCVLEPRRDRALEAFARQKQGLPNPTIRYFVSVPWVARAMVDLHPEYGLLQRLDHDVADLVSLIVSQENSCRFCYSAVRTLLWAQGMSKDRIDRIEQDLARGDLPPRTRAALAFGKAQSRSGPAAAHEACEALRAAGVDTEELKEIAYAVAVTDFNNRISTIPAIPPRPLERMPEQWHMRLLRPIVGRVLASRKRMGGPVAVERVADHPYAHLVAAYAGSPIAPALARTLEGMWASEHLTHRCKLLMLAVIARGLSCEGCARDLTPALAAEGLDGAALDRILSHLGGAELDDVERLLVPFARETIWYEPARIQRRARALREELSEPQLVEAIGVAALGNGLCRMGAILGCAA
jgi:AhpD family alkylhydroperoxidase